MEGSNPYEFLRGFVVEIPLEADLFNIMWASKWKVYDYDLDVNTLSIKLCFKKCCSEEDTQQLKQEDKNVL